MRSIASLIRELQKFPPSARCHGYEGEDVGLAIDGLGFIRCREDEPPDDDVPAEIYGEPR